MKSKCNNTECLAHHTILEMKIVPVFTVNLDVIIALFGWYASTDSVWYLSKICSLALALVSAFKTEQQNGYFSVISGILQFVCTNTHHHI